VWQHAWAHLLLVEIEYGQSISLKPNMPELQGHGMLAIDTGLRQSETKRLDPSPDSRHNRSAEEAQNGPTRLAMLENRDTHDDDLSNIE
jgi:hypothetical protein